VDERTVMHAQIHEWIDTRKNDASVAET